VLLVAGVLDGPAAHRLADPILVQAADALKHRPEQLAHRGVLERGLVVKLAQQLVDRGREVRRQRRELVLVVIQIVTATGPGTLARAIIAVEQELRSYRHFFVPILSLAGPGCRPGGEGSGVGPVPDADPQPGRHDRL
jgi:hypothetical protein